MPDISTERIWVILQEAGFRWQKSRTWCETGQVNDRYLDLRIDDDPNPVRRLAGPVDLHHLFFDRSDPDRRIPLEGSVAREIQTMLRQQSLLGEDSDSAWGRARHPGIRCAGRARKPGRPL